MYVIENGSKYAVNIDNAERIQIAINDAEEYCIDIQAYNGTYICTLGKYDDKESAECALSNLLFEISRGGKLYHMLERKLAYGLAHEKRI